MSTNTRSFAQSELDILVKSSTDPENRPVIEEFIPEILALCEKFGLSGQSGGSAPFVAGALGDVIKKLCLQQPICPITGLDEEWVNVATVAPGLESPNGEVIYQNWRCGNLFKTQENKAYYLDAIVWKTQTGSTWSGGAKLADGTEFFSRQFVKNFPFTPKTFYIDVIEEEVQPGFWEFTIKDEKQLDEVFAYYQKPE